MAKLKEILAPKLKKIAKTQVFGKSACAHAPPDCEKKALTIYKQIALNFQGIFENAKIAHKFAKTQDLPMEPLTKTAHEKPWSNHRLLSSLSRSASSVTCSLSA